MPPEQQRKDFQPYTQAEVNYTTLSPTMTTQACANCRFYDRNWCRIVEWRPEPIEPTGLCDMWTERKSTVIEPEPVPVMIVADDTKQQTVPAQDSKLIALLKSVFMRKAEIPEMELTGFKLLDDGGWVAWWSNNFEDVDGEIFTEKAIDDYIARVRSGDVPYPELWFAHIPGTKHGQATHLWRVGHFALAKGTFDDTPMAKAFTNFYRKHRRKVSHGYLFPRKSRVNGIYHKFTTFEISPLHPSTAANPFTSFEEIKSMSTVPETTKKELIAVLGADTANSLISAAEQGGKQIEETGQRYKGAGEDALSQRVDAIEANVKTLTEGIGLLVKTLTQPEQQSPAPAATGAQPAATATTDASKAAAQPTELDKKVDALANTVDGLNKQLAAFLQLQAPGSKSPLTQLNPAQPNPQQPGQIPPQFTGFSQQPMDSAVAAWLAEQQKQYQQQPNPMSFIDTVSMGMPINQQFVDPFPQA